MSKCLPMLQPVHEESRSMVSPTQQLGPHVLEREGKPMHSDDSPIRPDGCLSIPKFQRFEKHICLLESFWIVFLKPTILLSILLFISSLTIVFISYYVRKIVSF